MSPTILPVMAVLLIALAALATVMYRQALRQQQMERELTGLRAQMPLLAELGANHEVATRRLTRASRFVSMTINAVLKLTPNQVADSLTRAAQAAKLPDREVVLAELAEGMALLARASPSVAVHSANYPLLACLRSITDGPTFLFICSHLAVAVASALREPWTENWRSGQITWEDIQAALKREDLSELVAEPLV